MMKTNEKIVTPEIREKLSELKERANKVTALTIEDLSDEIDAKRGISFRSAMVEEMGDMDDPYEIERFAHGTQIDDIVISREAFFDEIIQEKASAIMDELHDVMDEVNRNTDRDVKCKVGAGYKVVFYKGDFTSDNHDEVKKHILKRENRKYVYPFIKKDDEVYQKQKELLGEILDVDTSASTLTILNKYEFLDSTLSDIVKKMYYSATSETDNPVYRGKEILYSLDALHRGRQLEEDKVVIEAKARNAEKRDKSKTATPTGKQLRG